MRDDTDVLNTGSPERLALRRTTLFRRRRARRSPSAGPLLYVKRYFGSSMGLFS